MKDNDTPVIALRTLSIDLLQSGRLIACNSAEGALAQLDRLLYKPLKPFIFLLSCLPPVTCHLSPHVARERMAPPLHYSDCRAVLRTSGRIDAIIRTCAVKIPFKL